MAAISTARISHGSNGLAGRIGFTLNAFAGAFAAWNDARMTRKALSALTDRELDDIGLVRGDIDNVASGHGA